MGLNFNARLDPVRLIFGPARPGTTVYFQQVDLQF